MLHFVAQFAGGSKHPVSQSSCNRQHDFIHQSVDSRDGEGRRLWSVLVFVMAVVVIGDNGRLPSRVAYHHARLRGTSCRTWATPVAQSNPSSSPIGKKRTEVCMSTQRAERLLQCLGRQHPFSDGIQLRVLRATDASPNRVRQRTKTPCQQFKGELHPTFHPAFTRPSTRPSALPWAT